MTRVQSPNVSEAILKYLVAKPPSSMNVVPLVLPVFDVPFREPFVAYGVTIGQGSTAWVARITVPEDEIWYVNGVYVDVSGGDGTVDRIRLWSPQEYCEGAGDLTAGLFFVRAFTAAAEVSISDSWVLLCPPTETST